MACLVFNKIAVLSLRRRFEPRWRRKFIRTRFPLTRKVLILVYTSLMIQQNRMKEKKGADFKLLS